MSISSTSSGQPLSIEAYIQSLNAHYSSYDKQVKVNVGELILKAAKENTTFKVHLRSFSTSSSDSMYQHDLKKRIRTIFVLGYREFHDQRALPDFNQEEFFKNFPIEKIMKGELKVEEKASPTSESSSTTTAAPTSESSSTTTTPPTSDGATLTSATTSLTKSWSDWAYDGIVYVGSTVMETASSVGQAASAILFPPPPPPAD